MEPENILRVYTMRNGSTWISARDAGEVLGWDEIEEGIRRHCLSFGIKRFYFGKPDGQTYISELNFYRLILSAPGEKGEKYRAWLSDGMIPRLLRSGVYILETESSPFTIRPVEPLAWETPGENQRIPATMKK